MMIEIRPIKQDEWIAAKRLIYAVAKDVRLLKKATVGVTRRWAGRNSSGDVENAWLPYRRAAQRS